MNIAVLDAKGAGLGASVIKKIRKEMGKSAYIIALGTNETAAENMLKSGADYSLKGEKNIINFLNSKDIDCLIGPIGIICSGGINGEITSDLSKTIFKLDCIKYIIPLKKHGIYIPGTKNAKLKDLIYEIVMDIKGKNISNL